MRVKVNGAPPAPKPVAKADIQGQGSIPYAVAKAEKTPDTAMGKSTTGKKRGMGAALRGSRFTSC
jgi:hypothetical protein